MTKKFPRRQASSSSFEASEFNMSRPPLMLRALDPTRRHSRLRSCPSGARDSAVQQPCYSCAGNLREIELWLSDMPCPAHPEMPNEEPGCQSPSMLIVPDPAMLSFLLSVKGEYLHFPAWWVRLQLYQGPEDAHFVHSRRVVLFPSALDMASDKPHR